MGEWSSRYSQGSHMALKLLKVESPFDLRVRVRRHLKQERKLKQKEINTIEVVAVITRNEHKIQ